MILNEIKLFFQMLFAPKYIRKGKCKQCGNCCRNITFKVLDNFIESEETFIKLQNWQPHYKNFFITGKEDGKLLFTCKFLNENNKCSRYYLRSFICRNYPNLTRDFIERGGKTLKNCGFYYEPEITFKDVLNERKK